MLKTTPTPLSLAQFKDGMRDAVLAALDDFMERQGAASDSGWKDQDLPTLFHALDAHAATVYSRAGWTD